MRKERFSESNDGGLLNPASAPPRLSLLFGVAESCCDGAVRHCWSAMNPQSANEPSVWEQHAPFVPGFPGPS